MFAITVKLADITKGTKELETKGYTVTSIKQIFGTHAEIWYTKPSI